MSLKDKIENAKPSDMFDDIPKWQQWLLVKKARIKLKMTRWIRDKRAGKISDR